MIKKVNEAWKRLLSNDYAYFLIFPLLFAIISLNIKQTDIATMHLKQLKF